jgi:hypothetical protein
MINLTDQQLHDAIYASSTAKPLADAGNDAAAASAISPTLPPVVRPIGTGELLIWAAGSGVLAGVIAGCTSSHSQIASACLAVQYCLTGGSQTFDLTNPAIAGDAGGLALLTSAGILPANTAAEGTPPTPGSMQDLLAYSSVPQAVQASDVTRVWAVYRPYGRITGNPS